MTVKRKRILASTLLLALASSPLLAAQGASHAAGAEPTSPSNARSAPHREPASEVLSSRINGRSDWDIDYPSQLAPQTVLPSGQASAVVVNTSGSAPAPAAD